MLNVQPRVSSYIFLLDVKRHECKQKGRKVKLTVNDNSLLTPIYVLAMASNLRATASNLLAMKSK